MAEEQVTMTVPTEATAPTDTPSPAPATETASSDGVQEQPASDAASETRGEPVEPAVEKPDYRKQYQSDTEFRAFVKQEADRLAQQRVNRELKKQALSRAREDPVAALEYAQGESQAFEAEETASTQAQAKYTEAEKSLNDLWKNKAWAEVYNDLRTSEGKAFHDEWAKDPSGFVDKLDDRITEILIDRQASVKAKSMAEAIALEEANKRLAQSPQLPTGSGSGNQSDAALLARVAGMSLAEYKENKAAVEAAENRRLKRLTG